VDAIGVGLASAASSFLPVYLTRLNASTFQIGLLSSMPAITGLILALPMGQWLQRQENIVKWFSIARLLVIASYALTGVISFVVPEQFLVSSVLVVWAVATIPQTIVAITFSVVMNGSGGVQPTVLNSCRVMVHAGHIHFSGSHQHWSIAGSGSFPSQLPHHVYRHVAGWTDQLLLFKPSFRFRPPFPPNWNFENLPKNNSMRPKTWSFLKSRLCPLS